MVTMVVCSLGYIEMWQVMQQIDGVSSGNTLSMPRIKPSPPVLAVRAQEVLNFLVDPFNWLLQLLIMSSGIQKWQNVAEGKLSCLEGSGEPWERNEP